MGLERTYRLAIARSLSLSSPLRRPSRASEWSARACHIKSDPSKGEERLALGPGWEAECAARTLRGDRSAFDSIVDVYAPKIYAHLYRMLKNREEAEDVTQESFLRAYRSLASYDPSRPFRPWMYAVATRTGLNVIRSRKRREETIARGKQDPTTALAVTHEDPVSVRTVALGELRERLAEAVAMLPEASRILVHLRYQEGMSIVEAAEVAGMSEGAARVALHRARKTLREFMVRK